MPTLQPSFSCSLRALRAGTYCISYLLGPLGRLPRAAIGLHLVDQRYDTARLTQRRLILHVVLAQAAQDACRIGAERVGRVEVREAAKHDPHGIELCVVVVMSGLGGCESWL